MSRKKCHEHLLDKSKEAVLAAIGCYNQPKFTYREESFCILMINAWELLLKAKILKDHNQDLKSLYLEDKDAKRKNGKDYVKTKYKKNQMGVYITISFKKIIGGNKIEIDKSLKKQLETLYELRNYCSHFINNRLKKNYLENFIATLQSYGKMSEFWFGQKISDTLFLIPLAFNIPDNFNSKLDKGEGYKLLKFISDQEKEVPEESEHSIRLRVDIKFERSTKSNEAIIKVQDVTKGQEATKGEKGGEGIFPINIHDAEEDFRKKYRWTYTDDLIPKLKEYSNFSQNEKFHAIHKELKKEEKLCKIRYLDWKNEKSSKKFFYSPNIMKKFIEKLGLK